MHRSIEIPPLSPGMLPAAKDEQAKTVLKYTRPIFGFTEEKSVPIPRKIIKNIPKMDLKYNSSNLVTLSS